MVERLPSVGVVSAALPVPSRKVQALVALLPLLVAVSGVDSLCICGGCARSDALLGVTSAHPNEAASASPCCRKAAAKARAHAQATHQADQGHGRPELAGRDCCSDHDAHLAPATVGEHAEPIASWSCLAHVAPTCSDVQIADRSFQVRLAEARGPPPPGVPPYRSTSRIRI